MSVHNTNLTFRIDTGAKCCIIVKSDFEKLNSIIKPIRSSKTLKSYTNHPVGTVTLPVKAKRKEINVTFEIVDLMQETIISGDVPEQLNLLQRINTVKVNTVHEELSRDFPNLIKKTQKLYRENIQSRLMRILRCHSSCP